MCGEDFRADELWERVIVGRMKVECGTAYQYYLLTYLPGTKACQSDV